MAARQHDYGNAQRISLAYLLAHWPQHAGDDLPEDIATRDPRAAWREENEREMAGAEYGR